MNPRHRRRWVDKVHRNAATCGMPLTEFVALTRQQRKRLLQRARRGEP